MNHLNDVDQFCDPPIETLLPEPTQQLLQSCPKTGGGVHNWLMRVAVRLNRYFLDENVIAHLLTKYSENCGRDVGETEIWDAIQNSRKWLEWQNDKTVQALPTPKWPSPNLDQIEAIVREGPNLDGLEAMSPIKWNEAGPHTEEIIEVLFPGNPLLCAGPKKELAITRTLEDWRRFLANQQFIVPSPMTAIHGTTKNGHKSMRCLDNTGSRRFLVVEFDQGSFDQHAALLVHLAKLAPLVLVVHSGNKSLHGWFYCEGQPEEKVARFFQYAVSVGADQATWTRCQLVRMPDGRRDNGNRQRVVYFNPQALV
jgi:hypothetical protein